MNEVFGMFQTLSLNEWGLCVLICAVILSVQGKEQQGTMVVRRGKLVALIYGAGTVALTLAVAYLVEYFAVSTSMSFVVYLTAQLFLVVAIGVYAYRNQRVVL